MQRKKGRKRKKTENNKIINDITILQKFKKIVREYYKKEYQQISLDETQISRKIQITGMVSISDKI